MFLHPQQKEKPAAQHICRGLGAGVLGALVVVGLGVVVGGRFVVVAGARMVVAGAVVVLGLVVVVGLAVVVGVTVVVGLAVVVGVTVVVGAAVAAQGHAFSLAQCWASSNALLMGPCKPSSAMCERCSWH